LEDALVTGSATGGDGGDGGDGADGADGGKGGNGGPAMAVPAGVPDTAQCRRWR